VTERSRATAAPVPGASGDRPAEPSAAGEAVERPASPAAPILMGSGLLAGCALLLWQVFAIDAEGFAPAGPRFFPLLVIGLLTVLSALYVFQQARAMTRGAELLPAERFGHMLAAALLIALLVAYAFLLPTVGYVVTTAPFFVATARVLGSRHLTRDVVVGIVLSLVVYLGFTRLLGVFLPQGVFPL
jgi:putative tricarboxylic transport membrane protein